MSDTILDTVYPTLDMTYTDSQGRVYTAYNAVIESTRLGFEDHGMLIADISFNMPQRGHQSFGGYTIGDYTIKKDEERNVIGSFGAELIPALIEFFVGPYGYWEDIKGTRTIVLYTTDDRYRIAGVVDPTNVSKSLIIKDISRKYFPND